MDKELAGKTALVTGSGRNIGRATALEFADRGANVIINSRSNIEEAESVATEARDLGVESLVVLGDVAKQETIDEIKQRAEERFGHVDIYVSNAAVRPLQSFLDTTVEDWLGVLDVQLNASFRLAKAFVPGMIENGWGRIIHITGPDGFVGIEDRAHLVVGKAGLRALTKCLALELGKYGITVNDVAPGNTKTIKDELSHPRISSGEKHAVGDVSIKAESIGLIPVGRQAEPEEVAYACAMLASPRAGFITGNVTCCFGGQWMIA